MYPGASFYMLARPYLAIPMDVNNSTLAGILEYDKPHNEFSSGPQSSPLQPSLPDVHSTHSVLDYTSKFRSLNSDRFPVNVPHRLDKRFFFAVGCGTSPCSKNQTCKGPDHSKFQAVINNVSFPLPTSDSLLQAYYYGQSNRVYTRTFPINPLHPCNCTGNPPENTNVMSGTKVVVVPFNANVEVVLQDTSMIGPDSHPFHLHGYDFFVVGQGLGNFDPEKDPDNFNLVDPVRRNTVCVPASGWVVIRFVADNPGELPFPLLHDKQMITLNPCMS